MNTFSTDLAEDLDAALRDLDGDDAVRAVVLNGAGDAFSAGIDLTEHAEFDSQREYKTWVGRMEEPFLTLTEMQTPVVAAAHGHAAANGIGLVAACDLAILAEGTQLGATAPKVGLFCMGPAVPLMRSLTQKRCLELLLTGELIDAETALEWGLVNRVVPEEDLDYRGEHYSFSLMTHRFNPGPIDNPDVPIFIGGLNTYNLRLAGELCDGLAMHPFNSRSYTEHVIHSRLAEGAKRADHSADEVTVLASPLVITGRTDEERTEARERIRRRIAFYGSTHTYQPVSITTDGPTSVRNSTNCRHRNGGTR